MKSKNLASAAHIRRHWNTLCEKIGARYSGTKGEQQAADYIEGQFDRFGLQNVHQHRFEFPNCDFSRCTVRAGSSGGRMKRIKTALPFAFSPSTPGDPVKNVRGQLVYLQTGTDLDFTQPTRGRIGLLIGSLALSDQKIKHRLMRSGLKALLIVDSRLPVKWTTSAGAAPQWMDGYRLPTASIAYFDAHELVKQMPQTIEVMIKARIFPAMSQNVIGEIKGSRRPEEVIVISGHHDCVWGNVGADDNGSGVVFTLEMARIFSKRRPGRTLRFISYGVEEKLSVGSYLYMRSLSPRQRNQCVLAVNCDGGGTHVGSDMINVTGSAGLQKLADTVWRQCRHPATIKPLLCPYSDHFPLNICGIPSIWVFRPSMLGDGLWNLHSVYDNLDNVSTKVISRNINTTAVFIRKVADADRLPFKRGIDSQTMKEIRKMARREYRHPWSPNQFRYDNESR